MPLKFQVISLQNITDLCISNGITYATARELKKAGVVIWSFRNLDENVNLLEPIITFPLTPLTGSNMQFSK